MKNIFLSLVAVLSFSATVFAKDVETGLYSAVDVETGEIQSTLLLRDDKTVNFKVNTPDFEMPEPGCEGTWTVVENTIISDLECPIFFMPQVHVEIDITTVTPESIRSEEGALVPVAIDVLGGEPSIFRLKKVE